MLKLVCQTWSLNLGLTGYDFEKGMSDSMWSVDKQENTKLYTNSIILVHWNLCY